jgi:dimethylhistidine N-methyltransferase
MSASALSAPAAQFASDVRAGLAKPGQKELPSKYLYDDVGTALFEAITLLPEYGLTRADERILRRHAGAILERLHEPLTVVELGSGSGRKTRWILEALSHSGPATYYPIDISGSALARCRVELSSVESIGIVGLERPFLEGLGEAAERRGAREALLVLFLGSSIGNFERPAAEEFLREIRRRLAPGDALLVGTDLVKPVGDLIAAYDDPAGVTAAFNLNLLARINRELGGDFALRQFAHEARYNQARRRIEMHLVSRRRQTVSIPAANLAVRFEEGETIWTEACHKFFPGELRQMAGRCGFACDSQWVDPEWPFAESLWVASAGER